MSTADLLSSVSRRKLLQSAGLASGTLFLPSLVGDKAAYAQGAPKRLVVFFTFHGPVTGRWEFRPPGMPATPQSEWELPMGGLAPTDFTDSFKPLYPHRNDLFILEGLALTSAIADIGGNNHIVARGHVMTGQIKNAQHVSFDQYVADQNAVPGRFKYLAFTPHGGGFDGTSFDTAGAPVEFVRTDSYYGFLANQFERVFGGIGAAPKPSGPPVGADLSRARRQTSVEFVRDQFQKVASRLGSEDKAKLLRHRDMLQDLALRVSSLSQVQCGKPTYPGSGSSLSEFEILGVLATKMFPTAMACDLTRVGLVLATEPASEAVGAPAGLSFHSDVAHPSMTSEQAKGWMVNYMKLYSQQFANMVAAFKSVPEGNGTMLDNTVLLWMHELGNGWHDLYRMNYVIAGGKNLGLRPGRYIKYAETGPNPLGLIEGAPRQPGGNYGPENAGLGPSHNRLLVSLMQALGVNRNDIGLTSATGTWGATKGMKIEMTGPLPRLT